jgi:gas vesicle protein
MYKQTTMTSKKIVAGILTGVAAGTVIALLISADKKKGFRKNMMKKGNDISGDLKEKFNDFIDKVESKFQSILH